jgi:DNA-directed RNA polymerase subunit L
MKLKNIKEKVYILVTLIKINWTLMNMLVNIKWTSLENLKIDGFGFTKMNVW